MLQSENVKDEQKAAKSILGGEREREKKDQIAEAKKNAYKREEDLVNGQKFIQKMTLQSFGSSES